MTQETTVTGVVEQSNDGGVMIAGTWYNISQYAKPAPSMPPVGSVVALRLDGRQFIRGVTPAGDQLAAAAMAAGIQPGQTFTDARELHEEPLMLTHRRDVHELELATRANALETAVRFWEGAAGERLSWDDVPALTDQVLLTAERFELWLGRPVTP